MQRYRLEYLSQRGWRPVCDLAEATRLEIRTEWKARAAANPNRTYRMCAVPFPAVDGADIAYWDAEWTARQAAERVGWPIDRILPYEKGWAVQRNLSGPYLTRSEWMAHPEH